MESKAELRHRIRWQRRQLDLSERTRAARRLTAVLRRSRWYRHSRRIACYWATDGEIDLSDFLQQAHQDGRAIYLPVLKQKPAKTLRFHRYRPGEGLRANRFGIPEPLPQQANRIACRDLDLVLVPLVAFDGQGHRLGMGAGYYDRTFAFTRHRRGRWRRPRLLGIAFSFQRIAELPTEPWDVPLADVATEQGLSRCQIERRARSSDTNRS